MRRTLTAFIASIAGALGALTIATLGVAAQAPKPAAANPAAHQAAKPAAAKPPAGTRQARVRAQSVDPSAAENAAAGPAGAFDGPELRPLAERCLLGFGSTSGPPILPNYFYNNLHQIVQTPTSVMILTEMVHDARIVRMNAQHLPPTVRKWLGDSVGRWEGDTLVVDTTNFTPKTEFRGSGED